jgi:hypothetical protein
VRTHSSAIVAGIVASLTLTSGAASGQCVSRSLHALPNTPGDTYFGQSAAADGDWLAIGAYRSVRLYHRTAAGWQPDAVLSSPYPPVSGCNYAAAVALAGDLLIVQAPSCHGIVVYRRAAEWTEEARLLVPNASSHGALSLVRTADETFLAAGVSDARTAYVYRCAGGTWPLEATLTAPDDPGFPSRRAFGIAVALTASAPHQLLVGDPGDEENGTLSGSVYVFARDAAGTWTYDSKLTPAQGTPNDSFGYALAVSGADLLVGANAASHAAYQFVAGPAGWIEQAAISVPDDSYPMTTLLCARGGTALMGRWGSGCHYLLQRSAQTWTAVARLELPPIGSMYYSWAGALLPDQAVLAHAAPGTSRPGAVYLANLVDCNTNGLLDGCDITSGTSLDCNSNGIPDECDPDNNGNGIPDDCEVCPGNANCDSTVDWRDIDYLIAGMNDNESAWAGLFGDNPPGCRFANLDASADGHVNWRDIDPFIARMNQTCP